MKKQYDTPTAKKVVFNFEKVTARSGSVICYWGSYEVGAGCHETYQITQNGIAVASIPDCGWVQEKE
jgi:hypothetical protein